jgi:hypothetical protein
MKDCTEDSLIWMLIAATILWQAGAGKIALPLIKLPPALTAACVVTGRLLPVGNRLTLEQKSGSLRSSGLRK